jgi:hypothetical protein
MIYRLAGAALVPLFALAAYVQLNDPDPVAWVAVYGAAALISGAVAAGRAPIAPAAVLAAVATAWSLTLLPGVLLRPASVDGLTTWHMIDNSAEESRELIGLLIVAVALGALAFAGFRREQRRVREGG